MRVVVKQSRRIVNEFQFARGPVHIGRHTDSQIFLPDRAVSRHHAVIFKTQEDKWIVEDLDSANKTYLNDESIDKAEIKTGDRLRITDFTIEINLEDGTIAGEPINMEDTLEKTAYGLEDTRTTPFEPQVIVRRIDSERAPDIKLPARRTKDFVKATEAICKANSLDEVLRVLIETTSRQFSAYRTWCALRNQATGPMTCNAGRHRDGSAVELSEIQFGDKITQAIEKGRFLLMPRIPAKGKKQMINSVMIAPVISQSGCFGVLYIDNDMSHESYTLSDLDYALLLTIHTAVIIENF